MVYWKPWKFLYLTQVGFTLKVSLALTEKSARQVSTAEIIPVCDRWFRPLQSERQILM